MNAAINTKEIRRSVATYQKDGSYTFGYEGPGYDVDGRAIDFPAPLPEDSLEFEGLGLVSAF